MKKIIKIILFVIIIIVLNLIFVFDVINKINEKKIYIGRANKEFHNINFEDRINSSVIYIVSEQLRSRNPLRTDLILDNRQKVWFKTQRSNLYKKKYLNDILKEGDIIKKNKSSDTLYVFNGNKKYFFILDFKH